MTRRIRAAAWGALATLLLASTVQAMVSDFQHIRHWTGTGASRAALVLDWEGGTLAWGYRFDGSVSSQQMVLDIVASDPRLFARVGPSGSFGRPIYGLGYDRDADGFAISDGTAFENGLAVTGPADGASAIDGSDWYQEGWWDGYWAFFLGDGNPNDPGFWTESGVGPADRMLADGDWDGFRFATQQADPPRGVRAASPLGAILPAAQFGTASHLIPEPSAAWMLVGLLVGAIVVSRSGNFQCCLVIGVVMGGAFVGSSNLVAAGEFASTVVDYQAGDGANPSFLDPQTALGEPTRFTSPGSMFPGAVTPFQSPFDPSEIVSIGAGGSLTLGFDNPIQDRNDSFGIDFIVFGNTIYLDASFPNGVVGGTLAEPGTIEVSQDGVVWQQVAAQADTPFPTLGYQDLSEPYPTEPGQIPTNFHQPVDPSLDPTGMDFTQLLAAYDGSGGGTGVDISSTGWDSISYVRISNPHPLSSGITPEIDAISVVPEPVTGIIWPLLLMVFVVREVRLTGGLRRTTFGGSTKIG